MNELLRNIMFVLCMLSSMTSYRVLAQTVASSRSVSASQGDSKDVYQISLLTCSPGDELYSMFGHSGIRVHNVTKDIDVVYNYGMFNYNSENFAFRFVKGETDYELGMEWTADFFRRYEDKDCEVREQVLNLTDEQSMRVVELLKLNHLPENRVYRYNFLYDNCTTRARDLIENAVMTNSDSVQIVYNNPFEEVTFREMIHDYTMGYPWVQFGVDLLLGAEVDRTVTLRESMFLPAMYELQLDSAVATSGYVNAESLSLSKGKYLPVRIFGVKEISASWLTPYTVFWGVLFCGLLFVYVDLQRGKISWWYDCLMLAVQGLVGIVITFMFLFSEHPAVGSNWLVLLFNPLPLIFLYRMIKMKRNRKVDYSTTVYAVWMTVFLVSMPFLPQRFNEALFPFVLIMVIRAWMGECVVRKGAVKWLKLR